MTKLLLTELLLGLPAMYRMGAILDTANLSITFKTDPHCSLDILLENGASHRGVHCIERHIASRFHTDPCACQDKGNGIIRQDESIGVARNNAELFD